MVTQLRSSNQLRTLGSLCLSLLFLLLVSLPAQSQTAGNTSGDVRGGDSTGSVGDRDNTRVMGTALDSNQQPLPGVQIWITNDKAPANRVRAKSRKTGGYLVRGVPRLYTRDDIYDIDLRVTFEMTGYQSVETVVHVQKDGLAHVVPVMLKESEPDPREAMSVLLVGNVKTSNGKSVKDAVITATDPAGGDLSVEVKAEKDGSYELLLWECPPQVKLNVTSSKGSAEIVATLAESPSPTAILAQTLDLDVQ